MRILIHGINFHPELTGIGKYTGEMADYFARNGHEVRVVTAPPYYPAWRVSEGYSAWRFRRETRNGVEIWRCPLWVPVRPSGIKRLLHLLSFALSSLPIMLKQLAWRPDLVMSIEPPLTCAPQAALVSRLSKAVGVMHIQDFEVDAAFEMKLLPEGHLRGLVLGVERSLMGSFDRISTISGAMIERLRDKGVSSEKIVYFPNWVDTDLIRPDQAAGERMRVELGIPSDRTIALYSGNLGEKQGLEILVEAIRQVGEDVLFVICGEGSARSRIVAQTEGLANVIFLPLQPLEKLNALLNMADIHLIPQRADAADLVMPSKLTGILSCGGAVIATAASGTELAKVVRDAGGMITPPGDASALSKAIERLSTDPRGIREMGQVARKYAENFLGQTSVLDQFLKSMKEMKKMKPDHARTSTSKYSP